MRTVTSGQLTALLADDRIEDFRLLVADSEGTMVDHSARVLDIEWGEDADQRAVTASVTLELATADGSLAPNLSDAIASGRAVQIDVVVAEADDTVESGDWMAAFEGVIDEWSDGGTVSELVLTCMDGWFLLQESHIEDSDLYGSEEGDAIEDVIQELLDDALDEAAPTIAVAGTPTTDIFEYVQGRMILGDAVKALLDKNGWDFRYRRNSAETAWEYRFFEPPRTNTTPVASFTNAQYKSIEEHSSSLRDVRTVCIIDWDEDEDLVVVEDEAAIAALAALGYGNGRRVIEIDATNDPQITSAAIALALGQAIVADLSQPLVTATVDLGRVWWPVEVGDLITLGADGVHLDEAEDFAVTRWRTRFSRMDSGGFLRNTVLGVRGRPSGGATRWRVLAKKTFDAQQVRDVSGVTAPSPQATVSAVFDSDGNLSAVVDGSNLAIQSWKILGVIDDVHPSKEDVEAATPIDGPALTEVDIGNLDTGAEGGQLGHVAAIAYSGSGGAGAATAVFRDVAVFGTGEAGIPDDSVGTPQLKDYSVLGQKLKRQSQTFTTNVEFFSSGWNHIGWLTGSIDLQDGTSVSISSGSISSMPAGARFIYFDGSSTLVVTNDYTEVLSNEDYLLLCTARRSSSEQGGCTYIPAFGGYGASTQSIATGEIVTNAIKAGQADVIALSAFSADLGTITSGYIQNQSGTTYIDLDATGTDIFIACGSELIMRANGSAEFGGEVTADALVATTNLIAAEVSIQALRFGTHAGSGLWNHNGARIDASTGGSGRLTLTNSVVLGSASGLVGFFGDAGSTKTTITGPVSGETTLTQLLTDLHEKGLITWSGI